MPEQAKMPAALAKLPERIPEEVSCRRPGDEIEPDPEDDEFVVFLAHFERGFGLPASDLFRQFLDFYKLQPHHLPGNAIFYLSCYATFMEAYMGLRPTRETFAPALPRIDADWRGICRFRPLDKADPDPYVHWADLKMGRIPISRPEAPSASTDPQVHEHAVPLQAEVGQEFLEKLTSQDKKRKDPEPGSGPSAAPPAKRPKKPARRHYVRREMPTSDGPALKVSKSASGMPPESSEDPARSSPPPRQSPVPSGAGNSSLPSGGTATTPAPNPKIPGRWELWFLPRPRKKEDLPLRKLRPARPSRGRAHRLPLLRVQPEAAAKAPPPRAHCGQTSTPPPKPTLDPFKGKATASGPQLLVLHTGRAAVVAGEKPTGLLGRITELKREGRELGHLLDYAKKWNQADVSSATRGVGRDRLPIVDPAGPKSTEEHFMRLKRAVREFDNAWHEATSNVVSTADARKQLFEELLWEHRDLAEAHSHCQVIPEASIEALKTQLSDLHAKRSSSSRSTTRPWTPKRDLLAAQGASHPGRSPA
ncbi:hypothetical protein QYE76_004754 [Lolium multiflorum]|uniref:Transposase (putative) gypsy type domain-containing protein n=1 Tax=Lolium multiflorum TaxID=4521 RepID=A0AAD8W1P2_LOLMU|nr:hypothetical protein QYE76_004754 [Lolium multiflorum]